MKDDPHSVGAWYGLASFAQAIRFGMFLAIHHMLIARTYGGTRAPDPVLLFGRRKDDEHS